MQACGDAHLSNFGGFATPERNMIFDINDLDETLPAPWEWDLKRLAASVVLAGRHIQPDRERRRRAPRAPRCVHYREHMAEYAFMRALEVWYDTIDLERSADGDDQRRGACEHGESGSRRRAGAVCRSSCFPSSPSIVGSTPRIKDNPPLIFHPTAEQAPGRSGLKAAWALYRESLPEHVRVLFDRFHLCDMAMKVVGVGSVGTMCVIALFMAADDDPLFLQIKAGERVGA